MVTQCFRWSTAFGLVLLAACGAHGEALAGTPEVSPVLTAASSEEAPVVPGGRRHHRGAHPPELVGQWARFWAPAGRTETARYWFRPDGTFVYRHPAGAGAGRVRRGHYRIQRGEIALTIEQEQLAGGPPQAIRSEEVLQLGHCPPNEEAEALDHSYACISLAGQAYFRCPSASALPESAFEL